MCENSLARLGVLFYPVKTKPTGKGASAVHCKLFFNFSILLKSDTCWKALSAFRELNSQWSIWPRSEVDVEMRHFPNYCSTFTERWYMFPSIFWHPIVWAFWCLQLDSFFTAPCYGNASLFLQAIFLPQASWRSCKCDWISTHNVKEQKKTERERERWREPRSLCTLSLEDITPITEFTEAGCKEPPVFLIFWDYDCKEPPGFLRKILGPWLQRAPGFLNILGLWLQKAPGFLRIILGSWLQRAPCFSDCKDPPVFLE